MGKRAFKVGSIVRYRGRDDGKRYQVSKLEKRPNRLLMVEAVNVDGSGDCLLMPFHRLQTASKPLAATSKAA